MECSKCGMAADGYKCDVCGDESAEQQTNHACGSDHCVPKCTGCGQAQTQCSCG